MIDFQDVARKVERLQQGASTKLSTAHLQIGEGTAAFRAVGSFSNKTCGLDWDERLTGEDIDRLVEFFASRGAEPKVECSAFTRPQTLKLLASRGFILHGFENVLWRSLEGELPDVRPEGAIIRRVDPGDDAQVRAYVEASSSGFLAPGEKLSEEFLDAGMSYARLDTTDSFIAKVDGKPAGGGGCETVEGVAALFGTSVLPGFRRRGIQQALIAARLLRAKERGATSAVIISGPGIPTERNAMRLGFVMAYTRAVLVCPGEGRTPSP